MAQGTAKVYHGITDGLRAKKGASDVDHGGIVADDGGD
jgi:hypothetical protein